MTSVPATVGPVASQGPQDEPEWLSIPLAGLPTWWGPQLDEAELAQLGGAGHDLVAIGERLECHPPELLAAFVRDNPPTHRYLVFERLSVTKWAGVYVAVDMLAGRPAVLKISRRRVEHEGNVLALQSHPNVVTVHDVFVHAGHPTMVLERCSGTLHYYAQIHGWRETLCRAIEAGRGLAHLHAQGFVHADVKPSNILISHDTGKLADFGLACRETQQGPHYGTPAFAAPERGQGVFVFAGDVYSLALTIEQSLADCDGVPESIRRLVSAAMAEDPAERPGLVAWLDALQHECERASVGVRLDREADLVAALRRSEQRRRWAWVRVAAVLVLSTGLGAATAALCTNREPTAVEQTLHLAHEQARDGDPRFANDTLELAHTQAKREQDLEALRRIGHEAVEIGEVLRERGHEREALRSWSLARDVFRDLHDAEGMRSVPSL